MTAKQIEIINYLQWKTKLQIENASLHWEYLGNSSIISFNGKKCFANLKWYTLQYKSQKKEVSTLRLGSTAANRNLIKNG